MPSEGLHLSNTYAQQVVASDFAKNRENVKGELCLNVIIPFFHHCRLPCSYVMFLKQYF